MKNDEIMSIEDMTVYMRITPERKASYAEFPDTLNDEIKEYLRKQGINALYTHQTEMFERAGQGENTVITTSTASGKTLAFLLPVLQKILEDPLTRAIFIYPTKALASDQYRALQPILEYFGAGKIQAGVYDGDTMPAERSRIRKSANIILTNPEMLNSAFLPNHSKYGFDFIFANLKYIVIDELHSYRGAFGAHLANIFRRMHRICQYYHSEPQFLCSSATIANPVELAENVCGTIFSLIEKDGSPSPVREYRIIQPPEIKGYNDKAYGRYAASTVAVNLLPDLVEEGRHFITFGKSRRNVEVILKEARDKLDAAGFLSRADSSKIAGYRGGYTPLERKEIERKMMSGELNGLVSTNALELGIDIGSLDTTVLVGYPGTRASFWQQSGRAGRNGQTCVNYLILENLPIDQYIAVDPGWLFEGKSENAIVDPDNLLIELAHIRAAAAELPLSLDDAALFKSLGEIIPVLMKAEEVKSMAGRFAWSGPAFPAGDYSLRNMDKTRFKLILDEENREITEMDETQAYHELHPDAVYMHEGALYEVMNLDLERKTATAKPFEGNYYTVPEGTEEIRILQTFEEKISERAKVHFGDINVDEVILGYKKLQFHNHQNLGFGTLRQPLQKDYDTESAWIDMPEDVVRVYRRLLIPNKAGELVLNNHFDGMENAIKNAAMMVTMTERDDIDTGMSNNATVPGYMSLESGESEDSEVVSLFIYDKYEGGLGYSEKIYELIPEVIDHAMQMVKGCPCEDGCPACVGDYTLSKKMVLWGLESLKEKLEAPEYVKKQIEEERPSVQKKYSFFKLSEKWNEFCESVIKNGESGGAFLKTVKRVETEQHKLILIVDNYFYEDWLKVPENARSIKNILKYHAVCPGDMEIIVRTEEDAERKKKTEGKLKRRYEDKF